MAVPEPVAAPVILPGALKVQLKAVPATVELSAMFVCVLLQMVSGEGAAVAAGKGLTVII
jgi:hypothetical protein